MSINLPILNLAEARFECTYGRGCDGVCCRHGRPPVWSAENERIAANLDKFLPHMRPEAKAAVAKNGYLEPRRRWQNKRIVRVVGGWCVFHNDGCVLHNVGASEGDKFRYKPALCALFPLQQDPRDRWYIRQQGYKSERWNLPCIDPGACTTPAANSLGDEIALAKRFDDEQKLIDAALERASCKGR